VDRTGTGVFYADVRDGVVLNGYISHLHLRPCLLAVVDIADADPPAAERPWSCVGVVWVVWVAWEVSVSVRVVANVEMREYEGMRVCLHVSYRTMREYALYIVPI
jgi:hypothetical protein